MELMVQSATIEEYFFYNWTHLNKPAILISQYARICYSFIQNHFCNPQIFIQPPSLSL